MINLIPEEEAQLAYYIKALRRRLMLANAVIKKTKGITSVRYARVIGLLNDKRGEARDFILEMTADMEDYAIGQPLVWRETLEADAYEHWHTDWGWCADALKDDISAVIPKERVVDEYLAMGRIDHLKLKPRSDQ